MGGAVLSHSRESRNPPRKALEQYGNLYENKGSASEAMQENWNVTVLTALCLLPTAIAGCDWGRAGFICN
jgi:hypothetical protein